jgi:hypothetical protein
MPTTYDITLHMVDGEVAGVTGPMGDGIPVTNTDLSPIKKSLYGLRHLASIREYNSKYGSLEPSGAYKQELATHCYMVIGGYKVEVPCS